MSAAATITVNGEARALAGAATVEGLLEQLGLRETPVAIELNGEIVRRERLASTPLRDGDRVEVVRFVQGG